MSIKSDNIVGSGGKNISAYMIKYPDMRLNNFTDIKQLKRGVGIDQIEQVTMQLPYAEEKYGESQLKFICKRL